MTTSDGIPPKTIEDSFIDWEAYVFGFGYGSGEPHIIEALRTFLLLCPDKSQNLVGVTYDYVVLEHHLTTLGAWLLINVLCNAGIIEYGVSPRFGWLTEKGRALREFMTTRQVPELLAMLRYDEEHIICSPTACNCGPTGYVPGRKCPNPFW